MLQCATYTWASPNSWLIALFLSSLMWKDTSGPCESTKFQEGSGRGETDKSVLPVTKKHLSQKNLLNQILRMNLKKRNQQSPNQNLVRKRRLQSRNLIKNPLDLLPPSKMILESGWVEEAVLNYRPTSVRLLLKASFVIFFW